MEDVYNSAWVSATTSVVALAVALLAWRFWCRQASASDKPHEGVAGTLPDELLLLVLSFLNRGQDLAAASAVCSRWSQVANDDRLWGKLLHRQFPDSPLFVAAAESSLSGLTVASLLQWRGAHHFPAHLRAEVEHVARLAEDSGVIAWRTLVAIEAKAAAGGCFASPRRRAGDSSPRLWKALKRAAVSLGVAPCLRRRWLLAGLDNAGKTTLAYVVKSDRLAVFPPTLHPETEEVTIGDQRFELVDPAMMWRRRRARSSAMQEYARHVHGLIFMVDACDPERFAEAKRELDARPILSQLSSMDASHAEAATCDDLLQELIEWDKPILVLGNKIDRPNAVSEKTLKTALGLDYCCTGKEPWQLKTRVRPCEVFMASIVKRVYSPGLLWLAAHTGGSRT